MSATATRRQILASAPLALLGLLDCASASVPTDAITIAYPADIPSWDPSVRTTPLASAIVQCVYDPPLLLSPQLKIVPGVVGSYRWRNGDARHLELNFRDDVLFHNGDRLTAADFKFTYFDRVQKDPTLETAPVWRHMIECVELPSPLRAIVNFRAPMPTAPNQFAEMAASILPKAYFTAQGEAGFVARPVGSGPYRLVDYHRDSRIVLEAFNRYWAGPARIRRVTFQVMADATSRSSAMQAGQADITINLSVRETQRLNTVPGLVGEIRPTTSIYLVHVPNIAPFTDRNVRLAAHHAIDKTALSRAFFGGQAAAISMLSPPGTRAYAPDFQFPYDPDAARKLLAASGYGSAKPLKVKFSATNGAYASDFDIARAIVQMWRRVGIDADLRIYSLPEYLLLSQSGKLPGPALWSWFTTTGAPETYGYILDPGKIFSVWKSDDVAKRFAELARQTDYDKLVGGYRSLEKWAVTEGYAMPLLQGTMTVVHKRTLGYTPFANGSNRPYYWRLA